MGLFLHQRRRQPEVMDQPDLCPRRHAHALAGLSRINLLSGTTRTLWPPLLALQQRLGKPRLRILDVACGGGDVVRRLWERAMKQGLDWRLAGCDISPVSVEYARGRAGEQGADVHYFVHDALAQPPAGDWDAILCSLFLHHLDDEQAAGLLARLARPGEPGPGPALLLVNDLDRSVRGLLLAHLACRLLSTSGVVHTDGPRSVRAAFTPSEALELARRAGLEGAQLRRIWPCRWLLSWSRP